MKLKFKAVLVLLIGAIMFCTACRKSKQPAPVVPVVPVPIVETATGQIARNIAQTLGGTFGGVNISAGVILPDFATFHNYKLEIMPNLLVLCSFSPDTVINSNINIGDTIKSQTRGLFKFYFSCDTLKAPRVNGYATFNLLYGYTAYDSLYTAGVAPGKSFTYNMQAFYTAKAQDTVGIPLIVNGSSNKLISYTGSVKSFVDTADTKNTIRSTSVHAYYTLTGVTVDLTKNGDITSGTATFAVNGSFENTKWYYSGNIQFLGNHMAKITINFKTYLTNLLTGKVTP